MKNFLMFLLGAIVGGIATIILASGWFTGIGAGVGVATGLQAGVCLAVEAAKDEGLITAEQVDQVLNATGKQLAADDFAGNAATTGGNLDCEKVIAKLKEHTQKKE
jgi:hypothetical protein